MRCVVELLTTSYALVFCLNEDKMHATCQGRASTMDIIPCTRRPKERDWGMRNARELPRLVIEEMSRKRRQAQ